MDSGIKFGRYRHHKGAEYIVFGTARHSETEEVMVVYRTDYGAKDHWLRPLSMFTENVEFKGKSIPRFAYIPED